jgi:hypothetical protein
VSILHGYVNVLLGNGDASFNPKAAYHPVGVHTVYAVSPRTARSSLPSPLRSPTTTELGAWGTGPTGGTGQGGAIANLNGGVVTVANSLIAFNKAIGGEGDCGNGCNGQGGGIFNGGPNQTGTPSLTLDHSIVALNRADGGVAVGGGCAGLGVGGGLYFSPGGVTSADPWTLILANDASTSDDDAEDWSVDPA